MDYEQIIEMAIAQCKDGIQRRTLDKFRTEYQHLLEAEADTRREKMAEDIVQMAKLKIALGKFCIEYDKIKKVCGNIEALDNCIADVETEIYKISAVKNRKLS